MSLLPHPERVGSSFPFRGRVVATTCPEPPLFHESRLGTASIMVRSQWKVLDRHAIVSANGDQKSELVYE